LDFSSSNWIFLINRALTVKFQPFALLNLLNQFWYFFSIPASFSRSYYFLDFFRIYIFVFFLFCVRTQKWITTTAQPSLDFGSSFPSSSAHRPNNTVVSSSSASSSWSPQQRPKQQPLTTWSEGEDDETHRKTYLQWNRSKRGEGGETDLKKEENNKSIITILICHGNPFKLWF